jgi:RHS repeat-associated protein
LVADGVEALENSYRFSTKHFDEETGLAYYGYRYYWPELGRWTQQDTIGDEGGLNLYAAMRNNAVWFVDPNGQRFLRADGSIDYLLPDGGSWTCLPGADCFYHDEMVANLWFSRGGHDMFVQAGKGIAALTQLRGPQIAALVAILTNPLTLCFVVGEGFGNTLAELRETAEKALFSDDFYEQAYYAGRLAAQAEMAVAGSVVAKVLAAAGMGAEPIGPEVRELEKLAKTSVERPVGGTLEGLSVASRELPTLASGPGGKMLGEAVGHLRGLPGAERVAAFEKFAAQITRATNGQWNAKSFNAINAHVFAGEGGEALVFDSAGNMFRGHLSDRAAFAFREGGQIEVIFNALRGL